MVENMQIPKGYKYTEIGIIPEDWEIHPLEDCIFSGPKYGINAPAVPYDDRLPTYIRITDISEDGHFIPNPKVSVKNVNSSYYYLQEGDLVFARTGASVGKSYLYRVSDGPMVFAGFLIKVRPDSFVLFPQFLSYYVQTRRYWDWVQVMSVRSGQPGINGNEYGSLKIPLPSRIEQNLIIQKLDDFEKLIENSEKLIAKKSHLKLATMQKLLTGKTRLLGFTANWTRTTLGDIGKFSKGSGIRRDDIIPQGLKCIRYGEIYTRYNNFTKTLISHISHAISKTATPISKGDLLFAGSGETSEEIGKCVAYIGNEDAFAGGDIVILHQTINDPIYLGFLLNQKEVANQKANFGQGDAVVHINATNLAKVEVNLPPKEEQTAIVNLLSDMDLEIEALEKQLAKIKALKQGMMQELLTGRIRLIQSESKQKTKSTESQTDKKHNWAINEAVIVSTLVNKFGSEQFPLGRKRYTKMSYLFHRYADGNTEGYLKMAAGPYNPKTKYGGVETIARKNGYIKDHQKGLLTGFVSDDHIQQAIDYFDKWYGSEALQWLEQFRYEKNDTLELWATVDMAAQDLKKTQKNINVENIKGIIRSNKEWKAKLTRPIFSADNIAEAIIKTQQLFTEGQT